jgi:transcriptional regulator with XRE-family HTH domain
MRLNETLERVELTQKKLAQMAGIGRRTLNAAKEPATSPHRRPASPATLRRIAGALRTHAVTLNREAAKLERDAEKREPSTP